MGNGNLFDNPITGRMIKSSPQKILAQGTDWRFLNELKRELKAEGLRRDAVGRELVTWAAGISSLI
jgi:hypothetical protein